MENTSINKGKTAIAGNSGTAGVGMAMVDNAEEPVGVAVGVGDGDNDGVGVGVGRMGA